MSPCVPKIPRLKLLKIYRCVGVNNLPLEDILKLTNLSFQYSANQHGEQAKFLGGKTLEFFYISVSK